MGKSNHTIRKHHESSFIHQEVPVTIRTLQAVGITAAAFLAGQQAAITYIATPAFLESPPPLLIKQWKKSFEISTGIEGFSALALGGIFSYLAYREPSGSTSAFKLYTTAAVETGVTKEETTHALVD